MLLNRYRSKEPFRAACKRLFGCSLCGASVARTNDAGGDYSAAAEELPTPKVPSAARATADLEAEIIHPSASKPTKCPAQDRGEQRLGRGFPVNLAKGFGGTGTVNYIPTSYGRELFARLSKKIRKAAAHSMVLLVVIAERSAAPIDERRSGAGRTSRRLRLACHRQTKPAHSLPVTRDELGERSRCRLHGTEGWLQLRLEYNLQYLLTRSF
jgi:hypothetical protein